MPPTGRVGPTVGARPATSRIIGPSVLSRGNLGFSSRQRVRDLWRHQDLPDMVNPSNDSLKMTIPAHGVQLYKLTMANK